jgi:aryl-alcohol dehydrogenase-like predicted oxidoreductase
MEYRNFGKAGVKVSPICMGTAFRGSRADEALCVRTIERALDLGCNFVDCANVYGTEPIVARALKGKRDNVVLTSKVCSAMGKGPNDHGLSRYHIMREVEHSLRRLETDHIDIYLLHAYDESTPIEETLRAMDDLARQGKIRYFGACNFNAWQVCEALWVSDAKGLDSFIGVQPQYNLLHRLEAEWDLMPLCRKHGLGMMTYSPLAIGLLTGRFRRGQPPPADSLWAKGHSSYKLEDAMTEQADRVVQKLIDISQERGKTPGQVAMAWILDHPEITAIIIGPDQPEHVDENLGAVGWQLTREERVALDEVSKVNLGQKFW